MERSNLWICESETARRRSSIRPVPAASAAPSSASDPSLRCRRPKRPPPARDRAPAACRTSPRTRRGRPVPAWGRNSKIPPPSLLTTTIRTGARPGAGCEPAESWWRARSPRTTQVGPRSPPRRRSRTRRARRSRSRRGWRGTARRLRRRGGSLLVADRHARGRVDQVAVARRAAASAACNPGSVSSSSPVDLGGDRSRARRSASSHAPGPASSASAGSSSSASAAASGSGRPARSPRRSGSARSTRQPGRPPAGGTSPSAASHWRSGLQVGMSPKRTTSSGASAGGRARATAS